MNPTLCEAIRSRRQLRFTYDGHERVVEPYYYGVTRDGRELLEAWFVSGWSASSSAPGWRTYHVEKIDELVLTDTPCAPERPGYKRDDRRFVQVHCCC